MNNYKYIFFCLIIMLLVTNISAKNISDFRRENFNAIVDEINGTKANNKFSSRILDKIIELEQPNDYQKMQIYNMFNDLCVKAKNSKSKSQKDLISFINSLIPDDSANFHHDTILFKQAFPENENDKPKGFFDCDARALMVMSVLEALKKDKNIYIVDLSGHTILTDIKTKQYYDLTLPDINVKLEETQLLLSNTLFSDKDIESLIITNVATEISQKNAGNIITHKKANEEKLAQAQALFKRAIELNPKNITAINNLQFTLRAKILEPWDFEDYDEYLKAINQKDITNALYEVQILSVLVANYIDNYVAKIPNQFIYKEIKYYDPPKTDDASDFLKAFKGSPGIADYTLNKVMTKLYYANMYTQFLRLSEELVKDEYLDSIPGIYAFYYKLTISAAMVKNFTLYNEYLNKFYALNKADKDLQESMKYVEQAVKIIKGEISPQKFLKYNDYFAYNLLFRFVSEGRFYNETFDAVDILKNWDGFEKFKAEVKALIPDQPTKQENDYE